MDSWVLEYLERIGVKFEDPTPEYLRRLQEAHMTNIPFENTTIMAKSNRNDKSLSLEFESLFDKLITNNRGGFCYELNGAFGELLRALGFEVTNLAALMISSSGYHPDPGIIDHMVLAVDFDEERYFVDVGGGNTARTPMRLNHAEEDISGNYRIITLDSPVEAEGLDTEYHLTLQKFKTNWESVYIFSEKEFTLDDYKESCFWMETTTKSTFTRRLVVSIATSTGRKTISGSNFQITVGNKVEIKQITSQDLTEVLEREFGILGVNPAFGRNENWEEI